MAKSAGTPVADRYKKLLDKIGSLNLGGGGWWKAPQGTSTIRILPPVGAMDYFFVEIGQHYIDDKGKPYYCPNICSEGQLKCPICEVNEALYQAGEKDAAAKFRAGRSFLMNVIDRAHPDQGVLLYAPGTTIFGFVTSAIQDPDYGDITDPDEGYDFKLERTGEGKEGTKYQGRPVKRATPLGTPEQMDEWMAAAKDLRAYVDEQLMDYEELAKASGVDVFFAEEEEPEPMTKRAPARSTASVTRTVSKPAPKRAPEPEPDDDDEDEEPDDEEEPPAKPSASARIGAMMDDRKKKAALLSQRRK